MTGADHTLAAVQDRGMMESRGALEAPPARVPKQLRPIDEAAELSQPEHSHTPELWKSDVR
jgi:hypothetical protein